MKKVITLALICALLLSLTGCGPSDEKIKSVRKVSFEGTELTVTLGTNKSTGYEWKHKIYGDCIEVSVNRSFKITGSKGDATGEVNIGFKGVSEGSATIVFTTPNGWDGSGEGDGYTVNVKVGSDGKIVSAEGTEGIVKTTLEISEIADGKYTGTLSGCSYSNAEDKDIYIIEQDISPAEITVTVKDGQIEIYCAASVVAGGSVLDVKAPASPAYTHTVSGTMPLKQIDDATVGAEADLPASGETPYINWDGDKKFTHWDIEQLTDGTYRCSVSITLQKGVPTAEIAVNGSKSQRTATVPLALK